MITCAECGRSNPDQYRFCLGCGHDLAQAREAAAAPGAAEPLPPKRAGGAVTVRIHVECSHCAAPVPVNGPVQSVHCRTCQKETPLSDLADPLHAAGFGGRELGSRYDVTILDDPTPQCVGCEAPVSVAALLAAPKVPGVVPCPKCGVGVPSWAAPAWLKAALPTAEWVFGGDPEALPPESGVAVELPKHETKPIAMACPQCGGGLTITADDARTTPCSFCGVEVFLPDELWLRLHPVKTMRNWTLTWTGAALSTAEDFFAHETAEPSPAEILQSAVASAAELSPPPDPPPGASSSGNSALVWGFFVLLVVAVGAALALAI